MTYVSLLDSFVIKTSSQLSSSIRTKQLIDARLPAVARVISCSSNVVEQDGAIQKGPRLRFFVRV